MTNTPVKINFSDLTDRKDGLTYQKYKRVPFTGVAENYYPNGQLLLKADYKNGKLEGSRCRFHENGKLYSEEHYKNNKIKDGTYESFYSNGQLHSRMYFKDGELHGLWELFYSNGQLHFSQNWKHGNEHGPYLDFYDDGRINHTGNYKNGKKHGVFDFYDLDTGEYRLAISKFYKDGVEITWINPEDWITDDIFNQNHDHDDVFAYSVKTMKPYTGLVEYFFESGSLFQRTNFKNGRLHGLEEMFHKNGQICERRNYKKGERHGSFEKFNEKGDLVEKGLYKDGNRHGAFHYFEPNNDDDMGKSGHTEVSMDEDSWFFHVDWDAWIDSEVFMADGLAWSSITLEPFSGTIRKYDHDAHQPPKLLHIFKYKDGKPSGKHMGYYPNGQIKYKCNYSDDNVETYDLDVFYPNGQIKRKERVKNRVSEIEYFDKQGKFIKKEKKKNIRHDSI